MITTSTPPKHDTAGRREYTPQRTVIARDTNDERISIRLVMSSMTVTIPTTPTCDRLRAGRLAEIIALTDLIAMIEKRIDTLIPEGVDG